MVNIIKRARLALYPAVAILFAVRLLGVPIPLWVIFIPIPALAIVAVINFVLVKRSS